MSLSAVAQETAVTASSSAPSNGAIPHVLKYTLALPPGGEVAVRVALYAGPAGGEALWQETERVVPDASGKTVLLLGSATEGGIPQAVFASAEARYVGTRIGDGPELPRTLLAPSAYALKAADAETLGGHPASDFALAGGVKVKPDDGTPVTQINTASGILGGGTGPTVSLTADPAYFNTYYGQLAAANAFTASNSFSKTIVSTVATGTAPFTVASTTAVPNLNASLLGGAAAAAFPQLALQNTYANNQIIGPSAPATTGTGHSSYFLWMNASVWNSSTSKAQNIGFQWRAEPLNNDTASPNANFALLSTVTSATPQETGFKITANGIVTFVAGQTYPGAGTITGVTAGTDLTGGGTTGNVTLGINLTALENSLDGVYASTESNSFGGDQIISGQVVASGAVSGSVLTSNAPQGTAPLNITSTTLVPNLNAGYLGGLASSSYATLNSNTFLNDQTLGPIGTATSNLSYTSSTLLLTPSVYNSSTMTAVTPAFGLRAEGVGSNSASPSALLSFAYGAPGHGASDTGLTISSTGVINFVSSQTFPAADLEQTLNPVYAALSGGNNIFGYQNFMGSANESAGLVSISNSYSGGTGASIFGNETGLSAGAAANGGSAISAAAQGSSSYGVYGVSYGADGTGVSGTDTASFGTGLSGTGNTSSGYGVKASGYNGVYASGNTAVFATGTVMGVEGSSSGTNSVGVYGTAATGVQATGTNYGVYASASGNANSVGVYSLGTSAGVQATAATGVIAVGTGANGIGVYGSGPLEGVLGGSTTAGGQGVVGAFGTPSVQGYGVFGHYGAESATGTAQLNSGYSAGVWADAGNPTNNNSAVGLLATADNQNAISAFDNSPYDTIYANNAGTGHTIYAAGSSTSQTVSTLYVASAGSGPVAYFSGPNGECDLDTGGDITCSGNITANHSVSGDAVPRRVVQTTAVMGTGAWVEDVGSANLVDGRALVTFNADFAKVANPEVEYEVFLTPVGECEGLYSAHENATGFEVHELHHGSSSLRFHYRIVAKKRGGEDVYLTDVTEKVKQQRAAETEHHSALHEGSSIAGR